MKDAHAFVSGEVLAGIANRPCTLRVLAGRVWVTCEGDGDDHFVSAGLSLALCADHLIVVEADAAVCQVEIACVNNRGALTGAVRSLGNLLRQPFHPAVQPLPGGAL
ncbi:DUF2917 domain-containing protein [Glaciimonas sp. GG7]